VSGPSAADASRDTDPCTRAEEAAGPRPVSAPASFLVRIEPPSASPFRATLRPTGAAPDSSLVLAGAVKEPTAGAGPGLTGASAVAASMSPAADASRDTDPCTPADEAAGPGLVSTPDSFLARTEPPSASRVPATLPTTGAASAASAASRALAGADTAGASTPFASDSVTASAGGGSRDTFPRGAGGEAAGFAPVPTPGASLASAGACPASLVLVAL
jgi:hypothetical protein